MMTIITFFQHYYKNISQSSMGSSLGLQEKEEGCVQTVHYNVHICWVCGCYLELQQRFFVEYVGNPLITNFVTLKTTLLLGWDILSTMFFVAEKNLFQKALIKKSACREVLQAA